MASLHVVGIELLFVEDDDRQAAFVELLWIGLELGGGNEGRGFEMHAVKWIVFGGAAGDGDAEAGFVEAILFQQLIDGRGNRFVFVLQGNEERFATGTQAVQVAVEAIDAAVVGTHGGEDAGGVE